jgi:peroxiredoxin
MIRKTLLAMPLLASFAASAALAGPPLPIGASIPSADVKMKSVDGTEQTLAAVKKPAGMLVVFTCNHCPFAKRWESRIVDLGNAYAAKGIGVIAVNANDPKVAEEDAYDVMQQRAKERGMQFPYVVDATSDVARAFGATKTPEAFVFDKDGKLVYHGTIDDNGEDASKVEKPYLKNALEDVLAGREVAVKETKSIGCGIKFRS